MEAAYTEREQDHRLESGKRKEKKCAALILPADEMMTAEEGVVVTITASSS